MKKLLLAAVALAAQLVSPTMAADWPVMAPAYSPPPPPAVSYEYLPFRGRRKSAGRRQRSRVRARYGVLGARCNDEPNLA